MAVGEEKLEEWLLREKESPGTGCMDDISGGKEGLAQPKATETSRMASSIYRKIFGSLRAVVSTERGDTFIFLRHS